MTIDERFWAKVVHAEGGCWEWTGARQTNGYGEFHPSHSTKVLAHRFAFELVKGPIPADKQLDHLCRNRGCVNPAHLEAVTPAENTRRSPIAHGSLNAAKTHCRHGHPFDEANTQLRPNGSRWCRACARGRWHRRKRALQDSALELLDRLIAVGRAEAVA